MAVSCTSSAPEGETVVGDGTSFTLSSGNLGSNASLGGVKTSFGAID